MPPQMKNFPGPPVLLPPHRKLVLASASPRRAELLREAGYRFKIVCSPQAELCRKPGTIPVEIWPACVALAKAMAVKPLVRPADIILAADTIVVVDGYILNKAHHRGHARKMLTLLSGRSHRVITGVAILTASRQRFACSVSECRMIPLTPHWLENYLDSGLWRGRAGAYGIQDPAVSADCTVKLISGEWSNVVGLPMELLHQELKAALNAESCALPDVMRPTHQQRSAAPMRVRK